MQTFLWGSLFTDWKVERWSLFPCVTKWLGWFQNLFDSKRVGGDSVFWEGEKQDLIIFRLGWKSCST